MTSDALITAVTSEPTAGQLPEGELDSAVEYTDENDASFLRRLWRDLYGDEPEPGVW